MSVPFKRDPFDALQDVSDQRTFLDFVKCLVADRDDEIEKEERSPSSPHRPGANGWENGSIEAFLEAAVSWAEASEFGNRQGLNASSDWRRFAEFLYAGKIYE